MASLGSILIFLALLAGMLIRFLLDRRLAVTGYVVATLGECMRQRLPLATALEAAAMGLSDYRSTILVQIARLLSRGASVHQAVSEGFPTCPGHVLGLIGAADKAGQLPAAFDALRADLAAAGQARLRGRPVQLLYPLVIILIVLTLLALLSFFILPKIEDILVSYGGQLPPATKALMWLTRLAPWWLLALAVLPVVLIVTVVLLFRPRRPDRPRLASRIGDYLKWHWSLLHWFEASRCQGQTAAMLRLALAGGQTVDMAIAATLQLDVNGCYRQRLSRWLEMVSPGEGVSQAARTCGVGKGIAWAFDEQTAGGNTLETLAMLERLYRSSYDYAANMVKFVLSPMLTIMTGLLVGLTVYGIFAPLIENIRLLSANVTP